MSSIEILNFLKRVQAGIKGLQNMVLFHHTRHEKGNSDEISVAGLSGVLADPQDPKAHAPTHQKDGADDLESLLKLANLAEKAHSSLTGIGANDHHAENHGADKHTNVTRELFLPPYGYTDGTRKDLAAYSVVQFDDAVNKLLFFSCKVPDDFVSFISVKLIWASSAISGDMLWRLGSNWAAAGENYTTGNNTPMPAGVTSSAGAHILNVQEPAIPLTLSGVAKGDYLGLYVRRDGVNGLDTLDTVVWIFGLLFTYVAEQ